MAILTKTEIFERIQKGEISFTPQIDDFQVQIHSVDLRLGFTFLIPKQWQITKRGREAVDISPLERRHGPESFDVIELEEGQYFDLLPSEHILVSSLETIKIPADVMGVLYPRSSINRRGLSVDLTGIVDSGYSGPLVLPVRNNTRSQTLRLYPGERFCQIVFEELTHSATEKKSRYHQKDVADGLAKENVAEIKFLRTGDIKGLKETYGIKF